MTGGIIESVVTIFISVSIRVGPKTLPMPAERLLLLPAASSERKEMPFVAVAVLGFHNVYSSTRLRFIQNLAECLED